MAKAEKSASKAPCDGRTGKHSKTTAGSALSQKAMSKPAKLTSAQAGRSVRAYLSKQK